MGLRTKALARIAFQAVGLSVRTLRGSNFHQIVGFEVISSAEKKRRRERELSRQRTVEQSSSPHDRITTGRVVRTMVRGQEIRFFVANEADEVQSHHGCGRFYEEEELQIIEKQFKGGVFVDIGANVGNHALYAAKFLGATKVLAIEPNPAAYLILRCNLSLNDLVGRVTHHAVGFSDVTGRASFVTPVNNLGGTQLTTDQDGGLELVRGDDLIQDQPVDFIKIDVEGMEMKVLVGLMETLLKSRPSIFVEIDNANIASFHRFVEAIGYQITQEYKRYKLNTNFLAIPRPNSSEPLPRTSCIKLI